MRRMFLIAILATVAAGQTTAQSRSFNLPEGHDFTSPDRYPFSLSADGTRLTYVARAMLWVSSVNGADPVAVRGPVEARNKSNPVFSPDGRSIIYWAQDDSVLERVPVAGGTPQRVAKVSQPIGISWGADGQVLVGQGEDGIGRVPANGGALETIIKVGPGQTAIAPQMLPDG